MSHKMVLTMMICLCCGLSSLACSEESGPISDIMDDTGALLIAPAGWEARDWALAGGSLLAVLAASSLDRPLHGQWRGNHTGLANIGNAYAYAGPAAAILLYGGAGLALDDREKTLMAWNVGEAAALSLLLSGVFKIAIGRERPNSPGTNSGRFHPGTLSDDRMSLPSGHTALAFSLAAVLQDADWHPAIKVIPFALAGLTAWSRVHDDRHWVSDTVAGGLIGYAVGRFVVRRNLARREDVGYFVPRIDKRGWGIVWLKRF